VAPRSAAPLGRRCWTTSQPYDRHEAGPRIPAGAELQFPDSTARFLGYDRSVILRGIPHDHVPRDCEHVLAAVWARDGGCPRDARKPSAGAQVGKKIAIDRDDLPGKCLDLGCKPGAADRAGIEILQVEYRRCTRRDRPPSYCARHECASEDTKGELASRKTATRLSARVTRSNETLRPSHDIILPGLGYHFANGLRSVQAVVPTGDRVAMVSPRYARQSGQGVQILRRPAPRVRTPRATLEQTESDGARQSPRGDSEPPEETWGPFGMAGRVNWLVAKNRTTNT